MANAKRDRPRLLLAARALADQLKQSDHQSLMRFRGALRISKPLTDGWRVVLGDLGKNQPRMELWLDSFARHEKRKFWACFFSEQRFKLTKIKDRVSRTLWAVRTITPKDTTKGKFLELAEPLDSDELAKPIFEKYPGETFFGIYDPSPHATKAATIRFLHSACAFFLQVVESLPRAKGRKVLRTDFPRCENRKLVAAHLRRERSGLLATECKARDGYVCQVCRKSYVDLFGDELGMACIDAHHIKPLARRGDKVLTVVEDLVTVCVTCHRMLHRMEGKPSDLKKLRSLIRKRIP